MIYTPKNCSIRTSIVNLEILGVKVSMLAVLSDSQLETHIIMRIAY